MTGACTIYNADQTTSKWPLGDATSKNTGCLDLPDGERQAAMPWLKLDALIRNKMHLLDREGNY